MVSALALTPLLVMEMGAGWALLPSTRSVRELVLLVPLVLLLPLGFCSLLLSLSSELPEPLLELHPYR